MSQAPILTVAPSRIIVTLVVERACPLCEQVRATVVDLAREYPLVVDAIDVGSRDGGRLRRVYRPPRLPLVLVGGRWFSSGTLSRRRLRSHLDARTPARSAPSPMTW